MDSSDSQMWEGNAPFEDRTKMVVQPLRPCRPPADCLSVNGFQMYVFFNGLLGQMFLVYDWLRSSYGNLSGSEFS